MPVNEAVYLQKSCSSDSVDFADLECDHEICQFKCRSGYAIEASSGSKKNCTLGTVNFGVNCVSIDKICAFPNSVTAVTNVDPIHQGQILRLIF